MNPATSARLADFEKTTGVEGTTLARKLLESALDYFEANGSITFPLLVIPTTTGKLLAGSTLGEPITDYASLDAAMKAQVKRAKELLERVAEPPPLSLLPKEEPNAADGESASDKRKRKHGR